MVAVYSSLNFLKRNVCRHLTQEGETGHGTLEDAILRVSRSGVPVLLSWLLKRNSVTSDSQNEFENIQDFPCTDSSLNSLPQV